MVLGLEDGFMFGVGRVCMKGCDYLVRRREESAEVRGQEREEGGR